MTRITLIGLAAASFTLAACNGGPLYDHSQPLNAGFGNSIQHNDAVAIIDPTPANATDGAPDLEAKRAKLAIDRYESGAVTAAEAESTSD